MGAVGPCCEAVVDQGAAAQLLQRQRQTPGDGAVVLLLKRVDDARRAGDEILAIIETGTDRPGDKEPGRPSELVLGLSAGLPSLSNSFGHAHAAAGLLHVAMGTLCLRERMRLIRRRRRSAPASRAVAGKCATHGARPGRCAGRPVEHGEPARR